MFLCYSSTYLTQNRSSALFAEQTDPTMQNHMLLLGAVLLLGAIDVTSSYRVWQLAAANGRFAYDMYRTVVSDASGENVFFSPFSISTALSMTYAGARRQTAYEMCLVLGYCNLRFSVHATFRATLGSLKYGSGGQYTLALANRLFAQKDLNIHLRYKKLTYIYYSAELMELDFENDAAAAADYINTWVEEQTNDKIQDFVSEDTVNNAALVLVNAIYFKAMWKYPFNPDATVKAPFHLSATESVDADMMEQVGFFRYSDMNQLDCQILQLPYRGERLSMYILLPNQIDGLASLESRVTFDSVVSDVAMAQMTELKVLLPKFTMSLGMTLKKVLQDMGMKQAFDKMNADFSDISPGLFLSEVVHKAFVTVGEKGTEAAAATGVIAMPTGIINVKYKYFTANHPFLFLIGDIATGSILFLGRLMKP